MARKEKLVVTPRGIRFPAPAREALGKAVRITRDYLVVTLKDGRIISTPLKWYPRLVRATAKQRAAWSWWGDGSAIHWPDLDEDLGINGMLQGNPSFEYDHSAGAAPQRKVPKQRRARAEAASPKIKSIEPL
jgi:hypothetical protein